MNVQVSNTRIGRLRLRSERERPQSELCLGAHQIKRLIELRTGEAILCTRGVLWVTQTGDPQDYLLRQGERFVAEGSGLVLVQTFDNTACWCYPSKG